MIEFDIIDQSDWWTMIFFLMETTSIRDVDCLFNGPVKHEWYSTENTERSENEERGG